MGISFFDEDCTFFFERRIDLLYEKKKNPQSCTSDARSLKKKIHLSYPNSSSKGEPLNQAQFLATI